MTAGGPAGAGDTVRDPAGDDGGAAALMRTAAAPDLDTTGIPVVLALTEVAGPVRRPAGDAARADGARLAALAQRLHTTLWPHARGTDLFTTYAVLATVGRADVDGAVPGGAVPGGAAPGGAVPEAAVEGVPS